MIQALVVFVWTAIGVVVGMYLLYLFFSVIFFGAGGPPR